MDKMIELLCSAAFLFIIKEFPLSVFQNRITFNNILKRLINKHYAISSGAFLIIQEVGCSIIANPLSVFRLFALVFVQRSKENTNQ